jgi:hypothetical protein
MARFFSLENFIDFANKFIRVKLREYVESKDLEIGENSDLNPGIRSCVVILGFSRIPNSGFSSKLLKFYRKLDNLLA